MDCQFGVLEAQGLGNCRTKPGLEKIGDSPLAGDFYTGYAFDYVKFQKKDTANRQEIYNLFIVLESF